MSNWKLLSGVALASIMTAAIVAPAEAQVTTSNVRGQVVDASGAAVSGATVTVSDSRTGRTDTATTNASGVYSVRNLRVGGPYTLSVTTAAGTAERENVFLQVNETFPGDLTVGARTLETVTVLGTVGETSLATGPSSTFGLETIESLPTISRDIRDIARLDPLVSVDETNGGAISIAGTNNRYNSLTIDGIKFNDLFGLNANGFPSQRSPISVDALETLSVEVAPYDVEFSGFTGGTVNVLTKSGQNDFFGSAYYFYSDDDMAGTQVNGNEVTQTFSEKTWGVTLGGPIIEDKLFFFASYEEFEAEQLLAEFNLPGAESGVSQATYDQVRQITQDVYGFDPLAFGGLDPVTDKKFLANIDWNINNDHSAKATFIRNEGNEISPRNNGADLGSPSTWYDRSEETNAYAVQVFSDWTENFSTEVKVAYSEQITGQVPLAGGDIANFEISTPDGTISIGPDFFRHANELNNELWQFKVKGEYVRGDHLIKFGYERDDQTTFNLFVPGSEGSYEFDSIADYQAQTASTLFYQNAISNDENDGAANFGFAVDSLYVQDTWQATDKLTVSAGVRYDRYSSDGAITENPNFVSRYGFTNATDVDGLDIIMPRIGINYEYNEDLTLRGGIGRFSGGSPAVWISNNYSNNGVALDTAFRSGPITNVSATTIPQDVQDSLTAGDGDVNLLDPNFEVPSLWRANIGADYYFDIGSMDGFKFTFDYIYGKNDAAAFWKDQSCSDQAIGSGPDGRPIYNCGLDADFLAGLSNQQIIDFYDDNGIAASAVGSRSSFDTDGDGTVELSEVEVAPEALLLTNVDKGSQQIFSTSLSKDWGDFGNFGSLYTRLSYTWQNAEDAHSGTSSTASSNYSDYASSDRQNPRTAVSNYQREHEFKLKLDWEKEFFENFPTKVTMFASRRSGSPFSYTYDYSGGRERSLYGIREGRADDEGELFYVPTGDNDPLFNAAASFGGDAAVLADFYEFLNSSGLNEFAGGVAPRNEFSSRWYTDVDIRIQQQLPGPIFEDGRDRLIGFLDIENVGNMINDEWGYLEQVRYEYFQPVANVDIVDGQYVYSGFPERSEKTTNNGASLWQVQVGVKYVF